MYGAPYTEIKKKSLKPRPCFYDTFFNLGEHPNPLRSQTAPKAILSPISSFLSSKPKNTCFLPKCENEPFRPLKTHFRPFISRPTKKPTSKGQLFILLRSKFLQFQNLLTELSSHIFALDKLHQNTIESIQYENVEQN